jgi:hypothetical protein
MMFRRSSRLMGDWRRLLTQAWIAEMQRRTSFLA